MSTLLNLCLQFMKIGLFAVGGGLATIPFLYDLSDMTGWFSHADLMNFLALSESTPGPIGINMATYVGYMTCHWYGGILATLSLTLPSIVIILIVAKILEKFRTNKFVQGGFYLLRPMSTAMVACAGISVILSVFFDVEEISLGMFKNLSSVFTHVNWISIIIFAVMFGAMEFGNHGKVMKFINGNMVFYVLAGAILGILFGL